MAEYKGIKGFKVQTVSTDPAASIIATGTWASGGSMNTGRAELGGAGIQTASIAMGGKTPGVDYNSIVEIYDGSSWTETGDLNTARKMGGGNGAGTTTAALAFGGRKTPADTNTGETESWNGSAWTEVNDLNTARGQLGGSGATYTAAIAAGGGTPSATAVTEIWNGTSWTEVNDLNSSRRNLPVSGTTTSALAGGGEDGPNAQIESWNGTSWTEISEANTARNNASMSCNGLNTDTIYFGGITPPYTTKTEFWNGTSWTEVNDLSTAKGYAAGTGTSTSAFSFGGEPGSLSTTEEWTTTPAPSFQQENLGQVFYNSTSNAFKVTQQSIPAGTWASGGTMNTARQNMGGFGSTNNDQLIAGGYLGAPGTTTATEKYNGTTWTTDPATLNTSRYDLWGFGNSQDAGIITGGYSTAYSSATESYNGTSWTSVNSMNTARAGGAGGGIQTSAIYARGATGVYPYSTASESWNGTSWTSTPSTSTGTAGAGGAGTSNTSGLVFGGDTYDGTPGSIPTRASTSSETWNGTSWTATPSLNTASLDCGGFGTATSAIKYGGANAAGTTLANTEYYNGTSWASVNSMADAARYINRGTTGSSISGLQCGGTTPISANDNATEEWAAGTANSTLTAS